MEYFHIKQDHRVSDHPKFANASVLKEIGTQKYVHCKSKNQKGSFGYVALPFMESPVFIVSKELKALFSAYQEGSAFYPFYTTDIDGKGLPYYVFRPLILDCLSDETEHLPMAGLKKIVLDKQKVGSHKVFQIGGVLGRYLIVDLEILEVMLYNGIYPVLFEPVGLSHRGEDN